MKQSIKIVSYFNNTRHSYFIGKLRDIQKQIYFKYITLICPGDTRWNSYCYCFKSLLKSRQALRVSTRVLRILGMVPIKHSARAQALCFIGTTPSTCKTLINIYKILI